MLTAARAQGTDMADLSSAGSTGQAPCTPTGLRVVGVQVVADLICPWCFIAKRSLDGARPLLEAAGVDVQIEWLPYQLNPEMPAAGMDRKEFRTRRFGWQTSLRMDDRAIAAGSDVGARIDYSRQSRTPNTLAAHALIRQAQIEGGYTMQTDVVDALFVSYFSNSEDISDLTTLAAIALTAGMEVGAVERSWDRRDYIVAEDIANRERAPNGVPTYLLNGKLIFSGSQSADTYLRRFTEAAWQTV